MNHNITAYQSLFLVLFFFISLTLNLQPINAQNSDIHSDTLKARQYSNDEKSATEKGDYQTALDVLQSARLIYVKYGLWGDAVRCFVRAAELSDYIGTTDGKIKNANLAFNMAQKHLPKNHLAFGLALRQKAEAQSILGNIDSTNYFLKQAIPVLSENLAWSDLGWCEIILSANFLNQNQLDSCQKHLKIVDGITQKKVLSGSDANDMQATVLNLLGTLYSRQGDYDKSIKSVRKALALDLSKPKLSALDSLYISQHYESLGAFYMIKGDYQRAYDHFVQTLRYDKNSESNPFLHNRMGELLNRQGKPRLAIPYFKKGWQLAKNQPGQIENQINSLYALSAAYRKLEQYDSSLFYCKEALSMESDYKEFSIWRMMGYVSIKNNKPNEAVNFLMKASDIYNETKGASGTDPFFKTRLFWLMGDAYFLQNNKNATLNYYQKALIANHSRFDDSLNYNANPSLNGINKPDDFLETMQGKAKTFATFGEGLLDLETALTTYQLTIQYIDTLQASYSSEASHLDWSGEYKQIYEEAIGVAFRLYKTTQDNKYLDVAFSISEKSKNAILLEALKATEGKSYAGVPDSLLQKEKDLNLDIAFYEKSLQKAKEEKDAAKTELYQNYLSKNRLELVALQEQLEKDYPKYQELKYGGKKMSIATVQSKLLNDNSAFLEYFVDDSTAFVFVITKQSAEMVALARPIAIKKSAADFRQALLDIHSFQQNAKAAFKNYKMLGGHLYETILQQALAALPTGIQQLIIVPDEYLNIIPFEAITKNTDVADGIDFSKLPYLLFDFQIHYGYSADLLLKNKTRSEQLPANAECLAFAPPYKGLQPIAQRGSMAQLRNTAGQLEGTAREVQAIAHFFSGQFDFGETATERQFKQSANQFGILHLAMHGVADFDNANFNHLIFSNLNTDSTEDNLLHHYEIANMNLSAQLAVLSACETGVGKYEKGEGVYSLARSFMYAGVPSVVMSLWKVSDESTSELMPYFYENLSAGLSKDAALHEAKKRFLKEVNLELRHPFFWSAFVMLGDVQEIKGGQGKLLWWGIGTLLLGMVGVGLERQDGIVRRSN